MLCLKIRNDDTGYIGYRVQVITFYWTPVHKTMRTFMENFYQITKIVSEKNKYLSSFDSLKYP